MHILVLYPKMDSYLISWLQFRSCVSVTIPCRVFLNTETLQLRFMLCNQIISGFDFAVDTRMSNIADIPIALRSFKSRNPFSKLQKKQPESYF